MQRIFQIMLLICISLFTASTSTADFDGSKPLLCAVIEVVDCVLQEQCKRVLPESVNLPTFFRMDFKKKEMSGGGRITIIKNIVHEKDSMILQGTSENGRGWSLVLSEQTGKFTGAAAGNEVGFIIFGSCTIP